MFSNLILECACEKEHCKRMKNTCFLNIFHTVTIDLKIINCKRAIQ